MFEDKYLFTKCIEEFYKLLNYGQTFTLIAFSQ